MSFNLSFINKESKQTLDKYLMQKSFIGIHLCSQPIVGLTLYYILIMMSFLTFNDDKAITYIQGGLLFEGALLFEKKHLQWIQGVFVRSICVRSFQYKMCSPYLCGALLYVNNVLLSNRWVVVPPNFFLFFNKNSCLKYRLPLLFIIWIIYLNIKVSLGKALVE